ncbi:MAG: hypothetical protein ABL918_00205 [Chakrabartia sp.]
MRIVLGMASDASAQWFSDRVSNAVASRTPRCAMPAKKRKGRVRIVIE